MVNFQPLYTDPEHHNAQRHTQADSQTDRQTDANSRSFCVTVRSARFRQSMRIVYLKNKVY